MAQDPEIVPEPPALAPVENTRPDQIDAALTATDDDDPYAVTSEVDIDYWLDCLDDAERAERDWRVRGREIVQIYRNDDRKGTRAGTGKRRDNSGVTFNILFANTEVMLPAVYMKPPSPVVRSRFTKPTPPPPPMPPMMPPMMPPPGMPPGMPPMGPPAAGPPGGPGVPPGPAGPLPLAQPPPPGLAHPGLPGGAPLAPPMAGPPPPMGAMPPPPMGPPPPPMPPIKPGLPGLIGPYPRQSDIDTAASIIEKALEIVVDDEHSHEAVKMAIKDVLLPGRGCCRVRWKPEMKDFPVVAGDGITPLRNPETGEPRTESRKVWEEVDDEYVYWEDLLVDPVRQAADMNWIAFRHLFTEDKLIEEFQGSSQHFDRLVEADKVNALLKWTDESAAKEPPGGGSGPKSAQTLGDHIKKAMVWEIWSRQDKQIIWFCRDASGLVLRVDPDVTELNGFYPIPEPMLAVRTSDSRVPRPFFDLYSKLADDLDLISKRISALTDQIKVRGAYNASNRDVEDILTADDNTMVGVEGVDLMSGGLQNHLWFLPIDMWMVALDKLMLAREQIKQVIYEVMGISDIMRGATKASETATAQRIKGSMGVSRLEDAKQQAANFVRDLLRLKAEIICQNFDQKTLEAMTGEQIPPPVMQILRSDFMRTCTIDIESDSTVSVDEQAEQQGMAIVMQAITGVMQGTQQMLMTGILPAPQVMQLGLELLKMFLHPVRHSRPVVDLLNQFQEQIARMPPQPIRPPPPPGAGHPPPGGPSPPKADGPPARPGAGGPPPANPTRPNGAPPVVAPAGPAAPPVRL